MNRVEQILAEMTKAEREAPATRGELAEVAAKTLQHMKTLKQRGDAFELQLEACRQRLSALEKEAHP
jgi:hypothetical protein